MSSPALRSIRGITAGVLQVTPEMAAEWLQKRVGKQRTINLVSAKKWVGAMERGEWMLSLDAIGFNTRDELVNGSHRLWAVMASKKTQPFIVLYGVPDGTFEITDTGRKRTMSDVFKYHDIPNHANMAALVTLLYRNENGSLRSGANVPPSMAQAMELYDQIGPALQECLKVGKSVERKTFASRNPVALALYLFSHKDESAAKTFFEKLALGADLPSNSPVLQLRESLRTPPGSASQRFGAEHQLGLITKAWNMYRQGHKTSRRIPFMPGEHIPEVI